MMKRIILILMALCAIKIWAVSPEELKNYAATLNKECPVVVSDGVTQKSVEVDGESIVVQLVVDNNVVPFQNLKKQQSLLHDAKVAELTTDSDPNNILGQLYTNGVTIIYAFTDGTDNFAITLLPTEF